MAQRLQNQLSIFKQASVYLLAKCSNVDIIIEKKWILTDDSSGAKHMITGVWKFHQDIKEQNQTRPSMPTY